MRGSSAADATSDSRLKILKEVTLTSGIIFPSPLGYPKR